MCRKLAVLALMLLSSSPILAQTPGAIGRPPGPGSPGFRPTVSPYLNLSRGGNQAINYYGLVRPQVEGAQALQSIEKQLNPAELPMFGTQTVTTMQGQNGALPMANTGTETTFPSAAGFMTQSRYYQNATQKQGGQIQGGAGPGNMTNPLSQRR